MKPCPVCLKDLSDLEASRPAFVARAREIEEALQDAADLLPALHHSEQTNRFLNRLLYAVCQQYGEGDVMKSLRVRSVFMKNAETRFNESDMIVHFRPVDGIALGSSKDLEITFEIKEEECADAKVHPLPV